MNEGQLGQRTPISKILLCLCLALVGYFAVMFISCMGGLFLLAPAVNRELASRENRSPSYYSPLYSTRPTTCPEFSCNSQDQSVGLDGFTSKLVRMKFAEKTDAIYAKIGRIRRSAKAMKQEELANSVRSIELDLEQHEETAADFSPVAVKAAVNHLYGHLRNLANETLQEKTGSNYDKIDFHVKTLMNERNVLLDMPVQYPEVPSQATEMDSPLADAYVRSSGKVRSSAAERFIRSLESDRAYMQERANAEKELKAEKDRQNAEAAAKEKAKFNKMHRVL